MYIVNPTVPSGVCVKGETLSLKHIYRVTVVTLIEVYIHMVRVNDIDCECSPSHYFFAYPQNAQMKIKQISLCAYMKFRIRMGLFKMSRMYVIDLIIFSITCIALVLPPAI